MLTAVGLIIILAGLGAHHGIDPGICLGIGGVGVTAILLGWVSKSARAHRRKYQFDQRTLDFSQHPKAIAKSRNNNSRGLGAA